MKLLITPLLLSASLSMAATTPERAHELTRFVRQECGFCHGIHLTGGLGSPLTVAALRDKPADALIAATLHGIPGTAMPGWAPYLSLDDVTWMIHALQQGLPE
jgi:cytochrome c55X